MTCFLKPLDFKLSPKKVTLFGLFSNHFLNGLKLIAIKTSKKYSQIQCIQIHFVIPLGFEPKTYRLEICCSIQLSYGTNIICYECH